MTPFHGFGAAVTGFEPLSGDSGTADVQIQWYAGLVGTGESQPKRTTPFHPGFGSLNHLGLEMIPVVGTKKFTTDTRKAHDFDLNQWTPTTASSDVTTSTQAIPWDSYGSTPDGGTGTSATLNTGGQTGSFTKSTIVPLVSLSLPTSIAP